MNKTDHKDLLELAYIIKEQCKHIKEHQEQVEEINGCADVIIEIVNGIYLGPQSTIKRMF
jgi:hypothetical protein